MPAKKERVPVLEKSITLTVNDEKYELRIQANRTLRQVLHDDLGLIGIKAERIRYI